LPWEAKSGTTGIRRICGSVWKESKNLLGEENRQMLDLMLRSLLSFDGAAAFSNMWFT
jgi:hypothetical protein